MDRRPRRQQRRRHRPHRLQRHLPRRHLYLAAPRALLQRRHRRVGPNRLHPRHRHQRHRRRQHLQPHRRHPPNQHHLRLLHHRPEQRDRRHLQLRLQHLHHLRTPHGLHLLLQLRRHRPLLLPLRLDTPPHLRQPTPRREHRPHRQRQPLHALLQLLRQRLHLHGRHALPRRSQPRRPHPRLLHPRLQLLRQQPPLHRHAHRPLLPRHLRHHRPNQLRLVRQLAAPHRRPLHLHRQRTTYRLLARHPRRLQRRQSLPRRHHPQPLRHHRCAPLQRHLPRRISHLDHRRQRRQRRRRIHRQLWHRPHYRHQRHGAPPPHRTQRRRDLHLPSAPLVHRQHRQLLQRHPHLHHPHRQHRPRLLRQPPICNPLANPAILDNPAVLRQPPPHHRNRRRPPSRILHLLRRRQRQPHRHARRRKPGSWRCSLFLPALHQQQRTQPRPLHHRCHHHPLRQQHLHSHSHYIPHLSVATIQRRPQCLHRHSPPHRLPLHLYRRMLLHPPRRPWLQPLSSRRPTGHQHHRPKLPPHLAPLRHHYLLHPLYRRIRSHRLHPWRWHLHPHRRHHRLHHWSHQQHQLSILRLVLLSGQHRMPAGRGDRPHPRRTPLHPLLQRL